MGARPALSLWGAQGSRCPSVPTRDLEQPPPSARCPLCAQGFRGTASQVTCGNFQPMAHRPLQRGEAPTSSCPSPPLPFPAPSWGGPGRSPATPVRRAGHHPSRLPWLAPEGWRWGWHSYQPTWEPWALLWLLPVRPGCLWGLRSQVRGRHADTPSTFGNRGECPWRHAPTGTLAPRQTCSGLYGTTTID